MKIIIVVSLLTVLIGCAAPSTGTRTAWDDKQCTADAGMEEYIDCLKNENAFFKANPLRSSATPSGKTPTPTKAPPVAPPTSGASNPPAATPTAPPQHVTLNSGVRLWFPTASGPYCSVPDAVSFEAINDHKEFLTDCRVECRGANCTGVVPLQCDAQHFVPRMVMRRNGSQANVWAVPPKTTAQYTTLPFNGGLGNVEITCDVFVDFGPNVPALAVGFTKHSYSFPKRGGGKNHQVISDDYMQKFVSFSVEQTEAMALYMPHRFFPAMPLPLEDKLASIEGTFQIYD